MADIVFPGDPAGALNGSALPDNQDLVIYKGDYVEILVTIKDEADVAVVLTDYTPAAQLKTSYDDINPISFTCTKPGATGVVRIFLSSAVSSMLAAGDYIWDFQLTDGDDETRTYLAGDATVYPEVTS